MRETEPLVSWNWGPAAVMLGVLAVLGGVLGGRAFLPLGADWWMSGWYIVSFTGTITLIVGAGRWLIEERSTA